MVTSLILFFCTHFLARYGKRPCLELVLVPDNNFPAEPLGMKGDMSGQLDSRLAPVRWVESRLSWPTPTTAGAIVHFRS